MKFVHVLNGIFTHFIGSLSQDDLAYMLGVHRNTAYRWECDEISLKERIVKYFLSYLVSISTGYFQEKGSRILKILI